jgi:hypothetical protein
MITEPNVITPATIINLLEDGPVVYPELLAIF